MKTQLKEEFVFLRDRYGLSGLRYFAFKPFRVPYFSNPGCRALYLDDYDCIVVRNGNFTVENLKLMLHEMCHAIQSREGRLAVPKTHLSKLYALEIEAEVFARVEYDSLYRSKYGALDHDWDLAHLEAYREFYRNVAVKSCKRKPMTPDEIYAFVMSLKGQHKKPILKRLRPSGGKSEWERRLSKVCI